MSIYGSVAVPKIGRSAFDLSHVRIFDCDIGKLIPVLCEDVLPGDVVDLSVANIIRSQPLVAPIYHHLEASCHSFFVPYRILFKDFERFMTGGSGGDETVILPNVWERITQVPSPANRKVSFNRYSLWDYLGFPIADIEGGSYEPDDEMELTQATEINDLPWRAFWSIWRDYYRDANHQLDFPTNKNSSLVSGGPYPCGEDPHEALDNLDRFIRNAYGPNVWYPNELPYRCWKKDYFTSALPWQQRGTSPVIPVSGQAHAVWPFGPFTGAPAPTSLASEHLFAVRDNLQFGVLNDLAGNFARWANIVLQTNNVDISSLGVSLSDLRHAMQLQVWLERNARCGYRYNEFIRAHFGVSPRDERLSRPEYIGGMRQPILISEVIQSSATDSTSPHGDMAGHEMGVASSKIGRYHVHEHGIIMSILSIMPEAIYQQGIPRQWMRKTRFDFYSPEFAHLSEQEIKQHEIFWSNHSESDNSRFGFQGAFDEYRSRQSVACGKVASSLNMWTLSRIFDGRPSLNATFLTLEELSKTRRSAWAVPGVQTATQGQFLIQWRNIVQMLRPMPYLPTPTF